jgi:multisubunit Na+/H+ antiporter MnhC subunit
MFEFFDQPEVIKVIVSAGSMFLFFIGLFGLLSYKHIIKTFMSIAIMEISIFLLFIGLTFKRDSVAPIIDSTHLDVSIMNDPIPHAMILTAIVIGMAVLALGTSFAIEYYKLTGNTSIDKMNSMRH